MFPVISGAPQSMLGSEAEHSNNYNMKKYRTCSVTMCKRLAVNEGGRHRLFVERNNIDQLTYRQSHLYLTLHVSVQLLESKGDAMFNSSILPKLAPKCNAALDGSHGERLELL